MLQKLLLIFLLINSLQAALRLNERTLSFQNVIQGVKSVQKVVKMSQKLAEVVSNITPVSSTRQDGDVFETYELCTVCLNVVDEFMYMRRVEKMNDTELIDISIEFCIALEIQSERVCEGLIRFNAPSIIHIVDSREDLGPETICGVLLDDGECAHPYNDHLLDFRINIDKFEDVPENNVEKLSKYASSENLNIVHITDIHLDSKYKKGSLGVCKDYACCRDFPNSDEEVNSTLLAGYWGDYRGCDTPENTIVNAFEQIRKQHEKIDVVYFTGDIVDHFIFDANISDMKKSIVRVNELIKNAFGDISVYSTIGNHEAQNLFAPKHVPEDLSTKWLYDLVNELWSGSLPKEAQQTIQDGGYYTDLVRPGLRVIVLNNNPCFLFNWWIFSGVEEIREQFQWLHDTLLSAEQTGEKVHILVHIPSNLDEVHEPCSREYRRIIDRFHKTIAAQFNGHTESYGFHLYYHENNLKNPVAAGFNGGSIAMYSDRNPNYVIYESSGENFEVTNAEVWTFNLTEANLLGSPKWYRQVNLKEDFELEDLSPSTLNAFVRRMVKEPLLFDKFWHVCVRNSDRILAKGCNKDCIRDTICESVSSDNTHHTDCNVLFQQLKEFHN